MYVCIAVGTTEITSLGRTESFHSEYGLKFRIYLKKLITADGIMQTRNIFKAAGQDAMYY